MSPLLLIFFSAATLFACTAANQETVLGSHGDTGSFKVIEIIVVVDTAALYKYYHDKPRSFNYLEPTPITHDFSYMMASYAYVVDHQASADLHIKAKVGDTLRFTGMSESANLDNAVIVYNITNFSGTDVTSSALFMTFEKDSVRPIRGKFPEVQFPDKLFWPIQLSVARKGVSNYKVLFAMYTRYSGDQKIFGYFEWDPTLTVPV